MGIVLDPEVYSSAGLSKIADRTIPIIRESFGVGGLAWYYEATVQAYVTGERAWADLSEFRLVVVDNLSKDTYDLEYRRLASALWLGVYLLFPEPMPELVPIVPYEQPQILFLKSSVIVILSALIFACTLVGSRRSVKDAALLEIAILTFDKKELRDIAAEYSSIQGVKKGGKSKPRRFQWGR